MTQPRKVLWPLFVAILLFPPRVVAQSVPPGTSVSQREVGTLKVQLDDGYGRLPLSFEHNEGQTDRRVKFLSHGGGRTLFLTATEAALVLRSREEQEGLSQTTDPYSSAKLRDSMLRMKLLGASRDVKVTPLERLPGFSNYFLGSDPAGWRTNIPTYAKVRYAQIYPGVDLVYYGNQRELEYDFVVAPGADPGQIRVAIRGARNLWIDADGNAVLSCKAGDIRLRKPRIYQEFGGKQVAVPGGYKLKGHVLRFAVAHFDHHQPLVIDPVLTYSTYLGGSGGNYANAIAIDSSGEAYIAGVTTSSDFPTKNPIQPINHGNFNVFVAKLNNAGNQLLYSTYLGGSGSGGDLGQGIAVDSSGNAYVTGLTSSTDFPVISGAFQSSFGAGQYHAFVAKLNLTGSALMYSTYLGGSGNDRGLGIAVDSAGNAYLTGDTTSANFPTSAGAFKSTCSGGPYHAFVTKLNSTGTAPLVYSTYLCGTGSDGGTGIAVDSAGNAYVTGGTSSIDFPVTVGAYQTVNKSGGSSDAIVTKLNPSGTALVYSTYLGGTGVDQGAGISVDAAGNAYVTGYTASTNFPVTAGALQSTYGGGPFDAFVTKLNSTGTALVYSTYMGGSGDDEGTGIAVDSFGSAYVTGSTNSTNFPITANALSAANNGGYDAFVSKIGSAGNLLAYSTYLGGTNDDGGNAVAADPSSGNAYVAGFTFSSDFPQLNSPFPSPPAALKNGQDTAFVAEISSPPTGTTPTSTTLVSSPSQSVFGQALTLTATVSAGSGVPTGTVSFLDGGVLLGSSSLSGGQASLVVMSLAVGSHSLTATYSGDATFAASASAPVVVSVNQATTRISLTSSSTTSVFGQAVSFTASLSVVPPGAGSPSGNIMFLDGQNSLGTTVLPSSVISTSSLGVGSHSISAVYQGDSNFLGSTSVVLTQTVNWPAPYQGPPSLLSVPVGSGPIAMALNSVTGRMYVANQGSNSVTVLSLATNSTITTISVGKAPSAVAVNPQTNKIYVADRDSVDVAVIDGTTNVATLIPVPFSVAPDAIAVNLATNKIYVGTGANGVLVMIDGVTNHVSQPDSTGLFGPIAFGISPLSGRIYVADSRDSEVEEYEGATNFLLNGFPGNTPQALAVNPPAIYVADGTGSVEVIDESGKLNLIRVAAGNNPYAIAANPVDNTIYVATQSAATGQAGGLVAIDGASNAITANYTVGQTAVPARVPTPNKIAVDASANLIYVANEVSNDVTMIDGAVHSVLATIPVGTLPSATVLDPLRCNVHVANFGSGNVTVIQPSINGPGVCFSPAALVFGPQVVGTTSAPQTVTFTNIGNSTLSVTSVAVSGDFNVTSSCPPVSPATSTPIAPGGQCTIQATSTPAAPGVRPGLITITDNASGSPQTIILIGHGVFPTTTQLAIIPNPVVYGQAPMLSANVVASQGIPTGTATFFIDGQRLGISKLASDGLATFNTGFPFLEPVGSHHTFTAVYNGDFNSAGSPSPAVQLVVNPASTFVSTFVTPEPPDAPQTLHAQVAAVAPGGGVPTGYAVFQEGQTVIGTAVLDAHGAATTPAYLGGGTHSISVSYQGDPNFLPSSSQLIVAVQISTTTTLQSSAATVTSGTGVTFTATVTATISGGGNMGGTIIFRDGPNAIGSFTLSGTATSGTVVTPSSVFPVGQHSITAEYQDLPGGVFLGSKSPVMVLTVSPAGGGTQTCACSLTGAYVAPATPVDPSAASTSPHGTYTVAPNNTATSLMITRNADGAVVFPLQNFPNTTNFGFSPDGDRFVLHYLTGSIDNVSLYDLTVQPARLIVSAQSPSGTTSTALSFSPSGRYFMYEFLYTNGGSTIAHLQIYQVQNVASQLLIYDSGDFFFFSVPGSGEDSFGVLGQGFSPDNPETSFVYSYVAGPNVAGQIPTQWNLVSLVTPHKLPEKMITLTDISDIWEYSPCGDVVGLIRHLQPNATGPSNVAEVDLIATATGLPLNPSGYQAATIQLLLNCTLFGQQVTDNSSQSPVVVTLAPNAGCTNTPTGANVTVVPQDAGGSGLAPVTITFNNVTAPGATTMVATNSGPPPPPNTKPGTPIKYFYLTTTAAFTSATVCISYADLAFGSSSIVLLHNNSNGAWDTPPNQIIDTVHQTICATVTSFSPFTIVEQVNSPTVSSISAPRVVYGTPASVTVSVSSSSATVTGAVTLSVDGGAAVSMPLSNGSAALNLGLLNAGSHSLSANFAAQGNFLASTANSTLVVTQAPLTITANNVSKIYGAALPTLGFTASGFVNGDTTASLTTQPTLNTTATAASAAGSYPISISGAVDPNYSIAYVQGTLTVTPALLTITANSTAKVLNAVNPTSFNWMASGFVNGDTLNVLTANPTCVTTATTTSPVGSYQITCSGASAANYTFSYVTGTLKIQYATTIGHVIQPPINADGTSVFRQGRTVPAKFNVYDANGVAIGTPGVVSSFFLTGILSGTTTTTVEDVVDTNNPDTAFRWDGQEWIFNITTGNLPAGSTYIYTIMLNDGSTIMFQYGLR